MFNQNFSGDASRFSAVTNEQPPVQNPQNSPGLASNSGAFRLSNQAVSSNGPVTCNPQHRGLTLFINIAAAGGTTPSITFTINAVDPQSGTLVPMLSGVAITAPGEQMLQIYPGIPAAANASANAVLPSQFVITYVISGTTPSISGTVTPVLQP